MDCTEEGGEEDSDGEGEGGRRFIEVGKKRKRKGREERVDGSGEREHLSYEALVQRLRELPEQTRIRDEDISPRLARPAQEDADKTPCG